jgi:orotate phosphoribosyltransferase
MKNKDYTIQYIQKFCMIYPDQPVLGKLPGTRYEGQYYLAKALYNVSFLEAVSEEFYEIIKKEIGHFNFQIAGLEWSACPLLTSIPIFMKKNYNIEINSFLIKKQRKSYGLNNYIEGIPNNKDVLIVDDVLNSSNSFAFCKKVIESENMTNLPFVFAVLNKYGLFQGEKYLTSDKYLSNDIKALYIINGDDVHVFN